MLRHLISTVALVLLVGTSIAYGQPAKTAADPIAQSLRSAWNSAKTNITQSADLMPEDKYAFKPVDGVRTFGQILAHVAGANYVFCSAAKGEKSPHAEDEFEKAATTKAAIKQALADSMTYCDGVVSSASDKSLADMIDMPFGMPRSARADAIVGNIGHLNEHYGNLVTYFRINKIVPPSSRRQ